MALLDSLKKKSSTTPTNDWTQGKTTGAIPVSSTPVPNRYDPSYDPSAPNPAAPSFVTPDLSQGVSTPNSPVDAWTSAYMGMDPAVQTAPTTPTYDWKTSQGLSGQLNEWASAVPYSDPSVTNGSYDWLGAINDKGGLNEGNLDYWKSRVQSDPNDYSGANPNNWYRQEDASRAAGVAPQTDPSQSPMTVAPTVQAPTVSTVARTPTPIDIGPAPTTPITTPDEASTPLPEDTNTGWDEAAYLAANPDVAEYVKNGWMESGKWHYDTYGKNENRQGVTTAGAGGGTTPADSPVTGGADTPPDTQAYNPATIPGAEQGLLDAIVGRAMQSDVIDPNDPNIRNRTDMFQSRQERARQGFLREQAEASGPYGNLNSERRNSAEQVGQNTSAFEQTLIDQELTSRRAEIQNALTSLQGYLTEQQRQDMTRELADLDRALAQTQMAQQNDQFGRSLTESGRQSDASRAESGRQFDVGEGNQNRRFDAQMQAQIDQFLKSIGQRAYEFDTSNANQVLG